ncbi:hypothetical protein GQ55_3G013200 [Panicum hallii var. hallii]|uniref:Uncharacterized protein n=1 Tax=Panicum hallii var. hallii TaxID=1504633 RepID=A0A2T7E4K8_9POAL|nr:hypothetical protein GQ55_3G013200 [Panicum hallii var. hallii]
MMVLSWMKMTWQLCGKSGRRCTSPLPISTFFSPVLLALWKHRHDVVFRSPPPPPPSMIGSSRDVAKMPNSGLVDCPLRTVMLPLHGLLFSLPLPCCPTCNRHVTTYSCMCYERK